MKEIRIGAGQAFALLMISRVFTLVAWVHQNDLELDGNLLLWGELLGFLFQLLLLLPAFFLLRQSGDRSAIELAVGVNKPIGKLFALSCAVVTLGFSLLTLSSFLYFLITTAFSNQATFLMFLLVAAVVVYGVCCGLEPLARTGTILFFFCTASLLFGMCTLVPSIQIAELHPVGQYRDILQIALERCGSGGELLCVILLFHRMHGKRGRWIAAFLGVSFLILWTLDFLTLTVMGNYASVNLYPVHALFGMAQFSIFQHLEAFHTAVWIFMGCLKTILYLSLLLSVIRELFPARPLRYLTPAVMAVFLPTALFICYHSHWIWVLQLAVYNGIPLLITVWFFPLLLLLLRLGKERKK